MPTVTDLAAYLRPDELPQAFYFDLLQQPWDAGLFRASIDQAFDGIGANEYIVDVTHPNAVDFISAVDTPYVWELNIWYHTLNVGYRARISGETDFPCIYGERVGLGRSYVRQRARLDYRDWVDGIREGRNYASDGKSHLLNFKVKDVEMGDRGSELRMDAPARLEITANVAALLEETPDESIRKQRYDQKPYWDLERARIGNGRKVPLELVANGKVFVTTMGRLTIYGLLR